MNPLIKSSVIHFEIEFIHPFNDGNGGIGRLWQSLILCKYNLVFEYLPIETLVYENQQQYYDALSKAEKEVSSTIFIVFMLNMILQTIEKFDGENSLYEIEVEYLSILTKTEKEVMKLTQIEDWKEKNKANNVSVEKVFNEEVAKGDFISMVFKSDGIDASNYRRKDKLVITVSKGKEEFEKNIVVPNFKNKSKSEVETWASEKEVKVEFIEEASSSIVEGNVISQDIEAKTKMAKNDTMKLVISKGKVAYVPNFYGLDETQATIEAAKANVAITSVKYYHNQVGAGQLISQSISAGSEVGDNRVVLLYSSGKPYVANFDGQDVFALVQSINEMNALGAKLTYVIEEVESSEPKGVIITSSAKAAFVNVGTRVTIRISRGS